MTAYNYLPLIAIGAIFLGWNIPVWAESDVTIVSPPSSSTSAAPPVAVTSDGTPVIHKSSHKKKKALATASGAGGSANGSGTVTATTPAKVLPSTFTPAAEKKSAAVVPAKPIKTVAQTPPAVIAPLVKAPAPAPVPKVTAPTSVPTQAVARDQVSPIRISSSLSVPIVETGLPVARHADSDAAPQITDSPIPISATLPSVTFKDKSTAPHIGTASSIPMTVPTSHVVMASAFPIGSLSPGTPSSAVGYNSPLVRTATFTPDMTMDTYNRKPRNIYPWKTNIITTMFWIGEGGSSISSTDNIASSWDEEWRSTNGGNDSPEDRSGYASGSHASRVNPFYIALPFNDLAFPDKAREWLPKGWHRPNKDGKPVSACQHRWVEVKNSDGRSCFAQWEDVGPLRFDHAEYVFGPERPTTYTRAGLDVSPAVAQYLGIDGKNRITRWRFVDDEDVPPGVWLKYDEQAVLYAALHQLKNSDPSALAPPIQKASAPIDDASNIVRNKKKVGAAKG